MEEASYVKTKNGFGWTTTLTNPVTDAMLDECASEIQDGRMPLVLDVGAALGVATLPALRSGAKVIANDIEPEHLEYIARRAREEGTHLRLTTMLGRYPYIQELREVTAIHCSNVLHFLDGAELGEAFVYAQRALKSGGKLFIQAGSPYAGHLKNFLPTYESRVRAGCKWPGEIADARHIVPASLRDETPGFLHALSREVLMTAMTDVGLRICFSEYYTRPGLPEVCRSDGRENIGVIGVKP